MTKDCIVSQRKKMKPQNPIDPKLKEGKVIREMLK
jgi:hypothetical protein